MQRQGFVGGTAAFRVRVTGGLLLAAYLAFVAWFALRPLDVPWVMPANLRPFDGIRADFALGWAEGVRRTCEGLALLAPLGVLLPMAGGRPDVPPVGSLVRTMAATALVSLAVEMLQTAVPGQVVDIDSLLLNTVGAGLAHAAVVPAGRSWLRRHGMGRPVTAVLAEEPAQGRTPTIPRVGIAPWSDALPPSSP
ncbi:VanZ family protein [Streptomyces capillispiralis]|uniref:VanZ like protein n=1 Tax=Streptomyces capillispiralis TaxID=68182 RepID=A0A561TER9_9ACTN|nr:VanZ family protein [Streptomyces capillispiralis]TWF85604.1 VanZ like protein [Streptomyces capillispiralis]GHH89982.1 VanZ family protein [Streptomyces capillispiralis]